MLSVVCGRISFGLLPLLSIRRAGLTSSRFLQLGSAMVQTSEYPTVPALPNLKLCNTPVISASFHNIRCPPFIRQTSRSPIRLQGPSTDRLTCLTMWVTTPKQGFPVYPCKSLGQLLRFRLLHPPHFYRHQPRLVIT